ncbi:hypothetical protein RJ639_019723 [Escallonia herrerae]|uniref:Pentatricopeptide repeat-containing protein n=1 Tax=Escallonia herrerae TaxID=1293975 RepID=A0AA89AJA9_9ASTE|nr:hypothetical protein RJ639_019723 [Escallonia herrerae]
MIKNASVRQLHVSNYLLNLYVKSHDSIHAHRLFDEMSERDVRSWTILISGLARYGSYTMSLDLFAKMQKEGIPPNQFTFSSVLKCCSTASDVRMGKATHGWILRHESSLDITLENSVLDFYVKRGEFQYAKRFFELISDKDSVSCNVMISGYLQVGDVESSMDLFESLPVKDVACWNTIIDGHLRNGFERIGLELLYQMVKIGPAFSKITFSIALVLMSSLGILDLGRQIHGQLLRVGYYDDPIVRNSLIDMYCKCGQLEKASLIFKNSPQAIEGGQYSCNESMVKSVSWSSLIAGYARNGRIEDALRTFTTMVCEDVEVDKFTVTTIISACANAGLLELGKLIHARMWKSGHGPDVFLNSVLIDMYAKCGRLDDAWSIFLQADMRNIVLWTSMIFSYAFNGHGKEAIWLFECMRSEGIVPNEVSFIGVLTACSHSGLLNEGCNYFKLMKEVYEIRPRVEHFTCMVDLFGRAGRFDEIKDFIQKNSISHMVAVWKAFLSSCRIHKNIEMARWVSAKLLELEPFAAESFVLSSNSCAANYRWDEAAQLRGLMQERRVKKNPGQSWIY